ncbi:MAG: peptide ABC transporter substrate-binding protein [Chloroflexota bacterium]|nr:peptide ABC transporter substrate-binding protein [Chloroflexota bacterium]
MRAMFRSPVPRPLGLLAACLMALPLVLTACGGTSSATNTPIAATKAAASAATTAPTTASAATTASSANTAATQPATSGSAVSGATSSTKPAGTSNPVTNLTLPADSKRGAGGTLRLLWWQAPTVLNSQIAQGTKDYDASRLVEEPLATLTNDAVTPNVPVLAQEIPSVQNGELAADGTSVTWKLKPGVLWSDGQPFTADDVVFTWNWVMDPKNGGTNTTHYDLIKDATAIDPTTVKLTFKAATPVWYLPFVGSEGAVLPQHILKDCPIVAQCAFNQKPIGTGAFVVTDFASGDHVSYAANDKFREPNAPWYSKIDLKGGGDAVTAVKAVQTGQEDYAWNPQVEPAILKQFQDSGNVLETIRGASVEKIYVNFADPSKDVNGEKSSPQSKSPFWQDKNVRQALALAIDRKAMAENLYGSAGTATNTIIPTIWEGLPWQYDPKQANALLDAAGWKMGSDGIRVKDGVTFSITFRTSVLPVRDKESQLIKNNLKAVGINVDLRPVDAGVFFGLPDNPDNLARFQTDLEMYTNGASFPDVQSLLATYTSDQIAQKSNGWKGTQVMRWTNPEYDQTIKQLTATLDPAQRLDLFKKADSILMGDYAVIPLVARAGLACYAKGLTGVNLTSWDSDLWNAAHWTK